MLFARTTILVLIAAGAPAQESAIATLVVDVENAVQYRSDIADPARRGADPQLTTPGAQRAFTDILLIGDIVAVNGRPARGLWTSRQFVMNFSPSPAPGFAVADVTRSTIAECKWEFLDEDRRFVGAISDSGLLPHAVTGGAGIFFGAVGQMRSGGTPPVPRPIRVASMSEDPSMRRTLGGGTSRILFELVPLYQPRILRTFHSDFSPVTQDHPAQPGEVLILELSGLGPLAPGTVPPGSQPFPDPPAEVNAPLEANLDGLPAGIINKVGWPGTLDKYRVDMEVPGGTPSGENTLELTIAWGLKASAKIPIR